MESIVFRWHSHTDNTVEWVTVNNDGRPHISVTTGSLHALSQKLQNQTPKRQAIFLLSANYYSLYQIALPPKLSHSNIKKAAPFAIEDELAEAIDHYHFVCGNIDKQETATTVDIAAINKQSFANLLAVLNEHHIQVKYVYPENLLLPRPDSDTYIFIENEQAHARLENGLAHSLPLDFLDSLIEDIGPERHFKIISQYDIETNLPQTDNLVYTTSNDSLLSTLAKQLQQEKPFNLLQGEFKYQEELGKHFKPWRVPLALATLALLMMLLTQFINVYQLEKQNLQLLDKKVAIYKGAFPRSRNIDVYSVRQRMEQAVKKAGGSGLQSSKFIPLLQQYASTSQADDKIKMNNIEFNKDKLSLTMTAKDIQVLDKVKVKLEKNKSIVANILSSKSVTNGVEATLKLESR